MRIGAIITSFTAGGAEMLVANLAERFVAGGHAVAVVALSDAAQVGNPPATEAMMVARLRAAGAETRTLGLANRNAWLRGGRRMRAALRAVRPDIIHSHTARALPLIGVARPGVPVVLTHHNSRLSFPPIAFRLFDHLVDGYVAISHRCKAVLQQHVRRPIRTIWNAADARFQAQAPRAAMAKDPVILAVGTISRQKDYPTLIRAARLLAVALERQGRRPLVRIAGAGPMLPDLQALVAAEGAGTHVELLGARGDVDALMRQADLFVNCSLWEGFPIALIEAAMSGLPIVATQVAGNSEMVVPGMNGRLVPPSDPQALADALLGIIGDEAGYATLSQGALRSAERFSIERCAEAHLAFYETLRGPERHAAASRQVAAAE